jgi:hypothetical protein
VASCESFFVADLPILLLKTQLREVASFLTPLLLAGRAAWHSILPENNGRSFKLCDITGNNSGAVVLQCYGRAEEEQTGVVIRVDGTLAVHSPSA